jgi:hypothetical protein
VARNAFSENERLTWLMTLTMLLGNSNLNVALWVESTGW